MIRLEDRQVIAQAVEQAHKAGARLKPACELTGITVRTLQRWKLRVVSNFDGLIFTIDDGPSTRMTAALAPRFLKGV